MTKESQDFTMTAGDKREGGGAMRAWGRKGKRERDTQPWEPRYGAEMAVRVGSPGPPEDHLHGEWWAVDIVGHLNYSHRRFEDDPRGETLDLGPGFGVVDLPRAGEPFAHTLAFPREAAIEEHIRCHEAGQDHAPGLVPPPGRPA